MIEKITDFFKSKSTGKIAAIILFFILGFFLILWDNNVSTTSYNAGDYSDIDYSLVMEEKLEAFLKNVGGIDDVTVFITTENDSDGGVTTDYFSTSDDTSDNFRRIIGVVISCTDGDFAVTKKKVTELVSVGLGIQSSRIRVTGN